MSIEPKYKLMVGAEDEGEVFDTWELAAQAAVDKGVGEWKNKHEFTLQWHATIKAVYPD